MRRCRSWRCCRPLPAHIRVRRAPRGIVELPVARHDHELGGQPAHRRGARRHRLLAHRRRCRAQHECRDNRRGRPGRPRRRLVHVQRQHDAGRLLGPHVPATPRSRPSTPTSRSRATSSIRDTGTDSASSTHSDPANPVQLSNYERASIPSARATSSSAATSSSGPGTRAATPRVHLWRPTRRHRLRGHPHLQHLRPCEPRLHQAAPDGRHRQRRRRAAVAAAPTPRPRCPIAARDNLYLYVGGSSGTCQGHRRRPHQDLRPGQRCVRASRGRASASAMTTT